MNAIAYVSDIPLRNSGIAVSRQEQRRRIEEQALNQGIEIAAFFEDRTPQGPVLDRPGLRAALQFEGQWDALLVERVWCLARGMVELRPLLGLLDRRGARLMAATSLWDVTSQKVRGHYRRNPAIGAGLAAVARGSAVAAAPALPVPPSGAVLRGGPIPAGAASSSQLPA